MRPRAFVSLAAVAALLLSTGWTSAEEDPGVGPRVGLFLGGGPLIVPGVGTLGVVGAELQAGVQFNRFLGLYALFDVHLMVGQLATSSPPVEALLLEFTFGNRIFVGVGPEVGFYDVSLKTKDGPPARSGYIYGGRLHFAWSLVSREVEPSYRRVSLISYGDTLTLGFDVRLLGGVARLLGVGVSGPSATASLNPLSILPMLTIGYVAR
jgi:hypothetical protein